MQVIYYHQTKCILATTKLRKSSCDIMPLEKALCNEVD